MRMLMPTGAKANPIFPISSYKSLHAPDDPRPQPPGAPPPPPLHGPEPGADPGHDAGDEHDGDGAGGRGVVAANLIEDRQVKPDQPRHPPAHALEVRRLVAHLVPLPVGRDPPHLY